MRIRNWYWTTWKIVIVLYIGVSVVYYVVGADTARVRRTPISFDRQYDNTLYKIDDQRAFLVNANADPNLDWFAVVNYRRDDSPLGWVCGSCVLDGSVINGVDYQKGDFVYTDQPDISKIDIANLVTGETFPVEVAAPPAGQIVDPAQIPRYRELGLTFEPQYRLTTATLQTSRQQLPAQAESCVVFQLAFWFVFGILALLGIPRLIRRLTMAVLTF